MSPLLAALGVALTSGIADAVTSTTAIASLTTTDPAQSGQTLYASVNDPITYTLVADVSYTIGAGDKAILHTSSACTGAVPVDDVGSAGGVYTFTATVSGQTLYLCFETSGTGDVQRQAGITVTTVPQTSTTFVTGITPNQLIADGNPQTLVLSGTSLASYQYAIELAGTCSGTNPTLVLNQADNSITRTFADPAGRGTYNVCARYVQDGGSTIGTDSAAQTAGGSVLTVYESTKTTMITGIAAEGQTEGTTTYITRNHNAILNLFESGVSATNSLQNPSYLQIVQDTGGSPCASATPTTEVSLIGFVNFQPTVYPADYALCLRVWTSTVQQQAGLTITVVDVTPPSVITLISPTVVNLPGDPGTNPVMFTLTGLSMSSYKFGLAVSGQCNSLDLDNDFQAADISNQIGHNFAITDSGAYDLCAATVLPNPGTDRVKQTAISIDVNPNPSSQVSGDPVTYFGNVRREFELPLGELSLILELPDLDVFASVVKGIDKEQWINYIQFRARSGKKIVEAFARDMANFSRAQLRPNAFETMDVKLFGRPHLLEKMPPPDAQYWHREGGFDINFGFARIPDRRFAPDDPEAPARREALVVRSNYGILEVMSSSAKEYYGSNDIALKYAHLDFHVLDMKNLGTYRGILPELWGLVPLSDRVRDMIKEPEEALEDDVEEQGNETRPCSAGLYGDILPENLSDDALDCAFVTDLGKSLDRPESLQVV